MNLLAQIADRSWQDVLLNYGPLGAFAVVVAIAVGWAVREWWKVQKPYLESKLAAEIDRSKAEAEKEKRQAEYVQRITDSHGEDMECKRRQVALLEKMDQRQAHHSDSCDATHKLVTAIHERLVANGSQ